MHIIFLYAGRKLCTRSEGERRVALGISGVLMHNSIRVRLETSIQLADYFFSRAAALSRRLVLFFLFLSLYSPRRVFSTFSPLLPAGPERRGAKEREGRRDFSFWRLSATLPPSRPPATLPPAAAARHPPRATPRPCRTLSLHPHRSSFIF